ncbi:sensor histidine kinase [Nocardioides pantholopis]|uniref:sensor histidine kinase n=1 Tax=Nocardioides pantholopis TaxID=2483798 RepID=UPI000F07760B|nr:HAMP domain-containing sensor histidine kinase [Nocardioides pantholopis]
MAERRWARASVRLRTTAAAVLVVALVLLLGAVALVLLVRGSLGEGIEASAEQRAAELAAQVEASGPPAPGTAAEDPGDTEDSGDPEDREEPEELVWQVLAPDGTVASGSQPLTAPLPAEDADTAELPGADHGYVVVTEDVRSGDREYVVVVAASLEEVDDSTDALLPPLLVGLPLVLLLVGGTTWVVATRALAPVERIRTEVEQITGDRLDRRVPEPPSRDEIHRLARTMNQMLARLERSRDRQQQFVADASHELRSPLASIRQTAEVARAHPAALPEGELAEAVLEESARMQRLVEQLLLLTRAAGDPHERRSQDVDLDDLALGEARRIRREGLGGGLGVDTAGIGPGRVRGDEVALAQVVRNLVDNAARHAISTIRLAVREVDGAGADPAVELVVEDDGPGIPEAERERVLDRFVRLDEARARDAGGSGLGLAIVRETVAAHGGTVTISAAPTGGARVVVRLPAAAGEGRS